MLLLQGGCSIRALMKLLTRACDYFFHPFVSYLLLKLILLKGTFLG